MERLLFIIAARSGGLASFHGMAGDLGVDTNTVRAHTKILEDLFLVRQLRSWHVNLSSRQIKSSKLHIVDSGLLAYLVGANERRISDDGGIAGTALESFATELLRQADWAQEPVQLFHYRDKQQREIDVILERHSGEIIGIDQGQRYAFLWRFLRFALSTRQARPALQGRRRPIRGSRHAAVRRPARSRARERTVEPMSGGK